MFRQAHPKDRPGILSLWGRVFGDLPAFINPCLDIFAGPGNVFVALEQEEIVAQLLAVPCNAGGSEGVYLYALATAPEKRKTGLMSALMRYAEDFCGQKGAAFSVLIPAGLPLFSYYQNRGYSTPLNLRHLRWRPPFAPRAPEPAFLQPAGGAALAQLRGKHCGVPVLRFSAQRTAFVLQNLFEEGALLGALPRGYCVCVPRPAGLYVAELCAADEAVAEQLLAGMLWHTGCGAATLTLAAASPLFAGRGGLRPYALAKGLGGRALPHNAYLRFALDDLFQIEFPPDGEGR